MPGEFIFFHWLFLVGEPEMESIAKIENNLNFVAGKISQKISGHVFPAVWMLAFSSNPTIKLMALM